MSKAKAKGGAGNFAPVAVGSHSGSSRAGGLSVELVPARLAIPVSQQGPTVPANTTTTSYQLHQGKHLWTGQLNALGYDRRRVKLAVKNCDSYNEAFQFLEQERKAKLRMASVRKDKRTASGRKDKRTASERNAKEKALVDSDSDGETGLTPIKIDGSEKEGWVHILSSKGYPSESVKRAISCNSTVLDALDWLKTGKDRNAECSVPMVDVPGFDCLGSAIQKSQPWDVTTLGMGNGIMHNSGLVPTVFPSAPAFPSTWPFHQSMPSPVFGSGSLASPGWLKFQGSEPYAAGAFQGLGGMEASHASGASNIVDLTTPSMPMRSGDSLQRESRDNTKRQPRKAPNLDEERRKAREQLSRTGDVICPVCMGSISNIHCYTLDSCHHRVCAKCLREHTGRRVEEALAHNVHVQGVMRKETSMVSSFDTSALNICPSSLSCSSGAQTPSSGTKSSALAPPGVRSSQHPHLIHKLLPPLDCPVKQCTWPLPLLCLQELLDSDKLESLCDHVYENFTEQVTCSSDRQLLSLECPMCGDLLWVPEGVVELPSGQFAENLSLNDLRKVLAELSLPRAGNRSEVYERLRESVLGEAWRKKTFFPPYLQCGNSSCQLFACSACGDLQAGPVPVTTGKGSRSKKSFPLMSGQLPAHLLMHLSCSKANLSTAVVVCQRLYKTMLQWTQANPKKRRMAKSRSSRADGTGYGGDHELAGGNSVETGKAKEREAKHDEQCETMLMTVRQYLTEICKASRMVELSTTTGSPSHSGSDPNPCVRTIDLDSSTAGSSQEPVCVPDSGIASSSCGVSPASSSTSSESCSIVYACSDPPPSGMLSTDPAFVAPPKSLPRPSEGVCNRQEPSHTGHPHPVLYAALRRCLLPVLSGFLHNSIMDMVPRYNVYFAVLKVLEVMAEEEILLPLLNEPIKDADGDKAQSLFRLLTQLCSQATIVSKARKHEQDGLCTNRDLEQIGCVVGGKVIEMTPFERSDARNSIDLAVRVLDLFDLIEESQRKLVFKRAQVGAVLHKAEVIDLEDERLDSASSKERGPASPPCKRKRTASPTALALATTAGLDASGNKTTQDCAEMLMVQARAALELEYVTRISELSFAEAELHKPDHYFYFRSPASIAFSAPDKRRITRITQEIASLSNSLPVAFSSSIFLRYDEQHMDFMKAMVIGPEGTPYSNGLFEFDIYLPPTYPTEPPQFYFLTTNLKKVRFNPNLYADGKVCLSLLGTWHGPSWDSKNSTLLQVLISIQSMILVPDPFFNEPGYESMKTSNSGMYSSEVYNAKIRESTVRFAMLNHLISPSPTFRSVIETHFRLKADVIAEQLEEWKAKAGIAQQPRQAKLVVQEGGVITSEQSMSNAADTLLQKISLLKPIEIDT